MPRLTAITSKSALPPEHQSAGDAVLKVFGHIRGPFSMLLHSPKLAEQLLPLVSFVRTENVIETRPRFVGILVAVRENKAEYVWAAQSEQARKNGVPEELIDAIRDGRDDGLTAEERDIATYVRQLVRDKRVDQKIFDAVVAKHDPQWMVELTAIVSFFGFVSSICNAFEVPPPH